MLETTQIIFLQMQKTGSSHAARVLAKHLDGGSANEGVGKHQPASKEQIESGKVILSSIRNPWDWYVSLWSFGAEGKGGLRHRLCQSQADSQAAGVNPERWRSLYRDNTDVTLFRQWLQHILDPTNAFQLGEDYGSSGPAGIYGFMTHRYLRLCCQNNAHFLTQADTKSFAYLLEYDRQNCYVDIFMRQETLSEDLCSIISGYKQLSEQDRDQIRQAERTNRSKRAFPLALYYDESSIQLVHQREALIVQKFAYLPPTYG
jgi:hypothetical protein